MKLHEWQNVRDVILTGWNESTPMMRKTMEEDMKVMTDMMSELSPFIPECHITWRESRRV